MSLKVMDFQFKKSKYSKLIVLVQISFMSSCENIPNENSQVAGFIAKTYDILHNGEFNKIIMWSPTGKEFIIKDIDKFEQIVLPRYFRHSKINSFVRQLNMYGFHKSRKDTAKSVFSHPNFQKDRQDLLLQIHRKSRTPTPHPKTPTKKTPPPNKPTPNTKNQSSHKNPPEAPEEQNRNQEEKNEVKECLFSHIDLNISLNKVSFSSFVVDDMQERDSDNLSIEENMEADDERSKQPTAEKIVSLSMFFNSFHGKEQK